MKDALSIEIPELALFDKEELKQKVVDYIRQLAKNKPSHHVWDNYEISEETKAIVLAERPNLPEYYDQWLVSVLEEKLK